MAKPVDHSEKVQPICMLLVVIGFLLIWFLIRRFDQTYEMVIGLVSGQDVSFKSRITLLIPAIVLIGAGYYLCASIFRFGNTKQKNLMSCVIFVLLLSTMYVCIVLFTPPMELIDSTTDWDMN